MAKVIPFKSKGKPSGDDIIDTGILGKLKYEVFKRGNIRISDKNALKFKKDCSAFEDALKKFDFDSMKTGDEFQIDGCGDNDHLVFQCTTDGIEILLRKRGNAIIDKLKRLLEKGKQKG